MAAAMAVAVAVAVAVAMAAAMAVAVAAAMAAAMAAAVAVAKLTNKCSIWRLGQKAQAPWRIDMVYLEYSMDEKNWFLSGVNFDTQKEAENFVYWNNLGVDKGTGQMKYRIKIKPEKPQKVYIVQSRAVAGRAGMEWRDVLQPFDSKEEAEKFISVVRNSLFEYRIKPEEPAKTDTDEIYIIESRPNTPQGVWNFGCCHSSKRKEDLEARIRTWNSGPIPNVYQHRIVRMVRAEGDKI
jgi:hypothetical protein